MDQQLNLMLIGLGLHAMRTYYPIVEAYRKVCHVHWACVVDVEAKRDVIGAYLADREEQPDDRIFLGSTHPPPPELPNDVARLLDEAVERHQIMGVVISTEPLAHRAYLQWALGRGLSVLIDKPISAKIDVSQQLDEAQALLREYHELAMLYERARALNPRCTVSVVTQRRHNQAFIKVRQLIKEVFDRTRCPITSITVEHADGEWRMPWEILDQTYHPYNQGYGVFCHSGYHTLDMVAWFVTAAQNEQKHADNLDIFTHFSWPADYLSQITMDDFSRIFGPDAVPRSESLDPQRYADITQRFGEIDGYVLLAFKKGQHTLTTASVNVLHNSFSQRGWVSSKGRNLYIGNGRVRQELYSIQQGPFQSIKILSFQKNSDSVVIQDSDPYDVGGKRHIDVHVFRNDKLFPDWKNIESFNINDLQNTSIAAKGDFGTGKEAFVIEFIRAIRGEIKREQLHSDLTSHYLPTTLLSGVYQSATHRKGESCSVINLRLEE